MQRLQEGLDYLLFRIYLWGGIAALVVYVVLVLTLDVRGAMDVPDTALLAILSAPISLWILGILAFWWWVFLFKGSRELQEAIRRRPESPPEIRALRSWGSLHRAMAVYGGSVDGILEAESAARRPVILWYGMLNLLVLWIVGNFWVCVLFEDTLPANYTTQVVVPGVLVAVVLVGTAPFWVGRARKGGEAAYLAPLGLSITESPADLPSRSGMRGRGHAVAHAGATVLGGYRRGRRVHVETMGRHSTTWVQAEMPPFEIHSQDGKLMADQDAPQAVAAALKGLRKAKRWRGVKGAGGPEGIGIERESPGQNMWLYDLAD
jgi:hypothetical protein